MRRAVVLVFVVGLCSIWSVGDAQAFECTDRATRRAIWQADAAFVGTVVEHREDAPSLEGYFGEDVDVDAWVFDIEHDVHTNLDREVEVMTSDPNGFDVPGEIELHEGVRVALILDLVEGYWVIGTCQFLAPEDFMREIRALPNSLDAVIGPPVRDLDPAAQPWAVGGVFVALGLGVVVGVARTWRRPRPDPDASAAGQAPNAIWWFMGSLAAGLLGLAAAQSAAALQYFGQTSSEGGCTNASVPCVEPPLLPYQVASLVVGIGVLVACIRRARRSREHEPPEGEAAELSALPRSRRGTVTGMSLVAVGLAFMLVVQIAFLTSDYADQVEWEMRAIACGRSGLTWHPDGSCDEFQW